MSATARQQSLFRQIQQTAGTLLLIPVLVAIFFFLAAVAMEMAGWAIAAGVSGVLAVIFLVVGILMKASVWVLQLFG